MARQIHAILYGVRMAKKGKSDSGPAKGVQGASVLKFSRMAGNQGSQVLKAGRQKGFASSQSGNSQMKKHPQFSRFFLNFSGSQVLFSLYSKQGSVLSLFTLRERLLCRQGGLKFCVLGLYFKTLILVPKFPFFRLYFNVLKFSPQRTGVTLPNQLT